MKLKGNAVIADYLLQEHCSCSGEADMPSSEKINSALCTKIKELKTEPGEKDFKK